MSAGWDEEEAQRGLKETQRDAANARERARMGVLSKAFSRLKTTLPWVPPDTKLSKLDTLRLASSYISHLRRLLQERPLDEAFVTSTSLVLKEENVYVKKCSLPNAPVKMDWISIAVNDSHLEHLSQQTWPFETSRHYEDDDSCSKTRTRLCGATA